jgi:hypothetical protein
MLRPLVSAGLLSLGLLACGGGGSSPDLDAGGGDDAAAAVDATPGSADATSASADAGPECNASGSAWLYAVGGTGNVSKLIVIDVGNADGTDGVEGIFKLDGQDVKIEDTERFYAIGESKFFRVDVNHAVLHGAWPLVELGTTPVLLTAMSQQSGDTIFASAGLTLYRITPEPYAIENIGTLAAPGCTDIIDFGAAISDQTYGFKLLLECGGVRKIQAASYTPGVNPLVGQTPAATTGATADIHGFNLFNLAVGDNLMGYDGTAFAIKRPLSACLGLPPGGIRGVSR